MFSPNFWAWQETIINVFLRKTPFFSAEIGKNSDHCLKTEVKGTNPFWIELELQLVHTRFSISMYINYLH
jgi:hypothetical protein